MSRAWKSRAGWSATIQRKPRALPAVPASEKIVERLGYVSEEELVHRDNMVLV